MNQQSTGEVFTRPDDRIRLSLRGPSRPFDARSVAIRHDLADVTVASTQHYLATNYAASVAFRCIAPSAMVRGRPEDADSAVTQLLHGEAFHVLDTRAGWAWGYCGHDHYVGYVAVDALARDNDVAPTHRIAAPGSLLFARADIKSPATPLPAASLVAGDWEGDFLAIGTGFVHRRHLVALETPARDWVAVAEAYVGMPYLWGGRGGDGIDCSGLAQVALGACGIAAPRDTDQQAQTIGAALSDDTQLRRGDLIFFPGHVGLMVDGTRMVHANAHWMAVTIEPLSDAIARLQDKYEQPVTVRRRI